MEHRHRRVLASAGIVLIFLLVQLGTLALVEPFQQEGHQVVEDTTDPTLSILYIVAIMGVTGVMLLAFKFGGDSILRLIIIFAGAYITFFVFDVLAPEALAVSVAGTQTNLLPWGGAIMIGIALYVYPEWYVIDTAGLIMGIGAAGLFGINFGILPALVLLAVLAVYDAISVYKTEHMLTLASGMMDMRVPVVLVVPLSLSYSFLDDGGPASIEDDDAGENEQRDDEMDVDEESMESGEADDTDSIGTELDSERLAELGPEGIAQLDDDEIEGMDPSVLDEIDEELRTALEERLPDRDALFIGLGDAIIPTVLVASAAFFVDAGPEISFGIASATLPAVSAMAGTMVGLVVLLWMVLKGRAHAGLPLLNGGTIAGYLIGALVSGLTLAQALGVDGLL